MVLLALVATTATLKPYYKEYMQESDPEFLTTDAYCWDVIHCKVRTREVVSEAGINTFIEHPDKGDPPTWWVITTLNAGYIPMAPSSICHIQVKAEGHFGLDDRTLHPQMYVQSFEYIFCIPRCDQSRHMLWWTPTLDDCPMVHNSPFSATICVLKPKRLNGDQGSSWQICWSDCKMRGAWPLPSHGSFGHCNVSSSWWALFPWDDLQGDTTGHCRVPESCPRHTHVDQFHWGLSTTSVSWTQWRGQVRGQSEFDGSIHRKASGHPTTPVNGNPHVVHLPFILNPAHHECHCFISPATLW